MNKIERLKKVIGTNTIAQCGGLTERHTYNLYNTFKRLWSNNKRISTRDNHLLQCSITKRIEELNNLMELVKNEY